MAFTRGSYLFLMSVMPCPTTVMWYQHVHTVEPSGTSINSALLCSAASSFWPVLPVKDKDSQPVVSHAKTKEADRLQALPRTALKRNVSVQPGGHAFQGNSPCKSRARAHTVSDDWPLCEWHSQNSPSLHRGLGQLCKRKCQGQGNRNWELQCWSVSSWQTGHPVGNLCVTGMEEEVECGSDLEDAKSVGKGQTEWDLKAVDV